MKDFKKRLKLVIFGVILPLLLSFLLIFFIFLKFSNLLIPNIKNNGQTYTQTANTPTSNVVIGEVKEPQENSKPTNNNAGISETKPPIKADTNPNWWEYPDKIYNTKRNGNDLLVLVNKQYKLSSSYAPTDLVNANSSGIRTKSGSTYYLRKILINDLKELNSAAKLEGIDLSIVSGYRSYSTQLSTYQYWVKYNNGCISCADKISARAGHSQHQLGTALDFSSNEIGDALGSQFDNTKASKWLSNNAYKYGFVLSYPKGSESITGYSYESWHYRYIGRDNATEMVSEGKILEKYLEGKN